MLHIYLRGLFAAVLLVTLGITPVQAKMAADDPDGGDELTIKHDPDGGDEKTAFEGGLNSDSFGGDKIGVADDPDGGDEKAAVAGIKDDPDGGDEIAPDPDGGDEASKVRTSDKKQAEVLAFVKS